jgi:hypothetical protein
VQLEHSKAFKYDNGRFEIRISIQEFASGDQRVHLETEHPSASLILHWGVQGGKNYKGGWRLPEQRPPDTTQYKERALQTLWQCAPASHFVRISPSSFSHGSACTSSLRTVCRTERTQA